MALTTRAKVKRFMGIDDDDCTYDTMIDAMIPATTDMIKKFLNYNPERGTVTDLILSGTGLDRMCVVQGSPQVRLPIYSITTLLHDLGGYYNKASGAFPVANDLTEGSDFVPEYAGQDSAGTNICTNGMLYRIGGTWLPGRGNYKITYVGGYQSTEIPSVFELAANILTAGYADGTYTGGGTITSQRLGDYSVNYGGTESASGNSRTKEEILPPDIKRILQPYRVMVLTAMYPHVSRDVMRYV